MDGAARKGVAFRVKLSASEPRIKALREKVAEVARMTFEYGLSLWSEGNVSSRVRSFEGLMVITPSVYSRPNIKAEDTLLIDFEGNVLLGEMNPSIEYRTHAAIYKARKDVGGVVHTHSTYASALAVAHRSVPPVLEEQISLLGGEIVTAEYGHYGSEELATNVVRGLGNKNAVFLANHGALTCGKDLDTAFRNAVLLEKASKIFVLSKIIGGAEPLPPDVVIQEAELFNSLKELD